MHVVTYLSFKNYFSKKNSSQSKLHIEITWGAFNTRDSCVLNPLFPFWFHWGTAWELGFINGLQVALSFSRGWAPWGWMPSCQSFKLCSVPQIYWMHKMERMQRPLQEASQWTGDLEPAPTPTRFNSWPFHCGILVLGLPSCHGFQGSSLRPPCPLLGGESCNQAIAQGCSHESLYWQIVINFNEINLLRNKSPRWHLQINGLLLAGGIKRRDLLLLWMGGRGCAYFCSI